MTNTIAGLAVIDTFLANWKVQATEFYTNLRQQNYAKRREEYEINATNLAKIEKAGFGIGGKYSPEKIEEILSKIANGEMPRYTIDKLKQEITWQLYKNWKEVIGKTAIAIVEDAYNDELLSKLLDKEVERKKKALIATVEKKAGKIVDASGLSIGDNADINGTVIGETASVQVTTITAGGYNIQCLHYRVLVKEVKAPKAKKAAKAEVAPVVEEVSAAPEAVEAPVAVEVASPVVETVEAVEAPVAPAKTVTMRNETSIKIPEKYAHMLEIVYHDSDGYWAETKAGYYSPYMDCHTLHEDTQAQLLKVIRGIKPCNCSECERELSGNLTEWEKKAIAHLNGEETPTVLKLGREMVEVEIERKEPETEFQSGDWVKVRLVKADNTYAYDCEGTEPCWTDAKVISGDGRSYRVALTGSREQIVVPASRVKASPYTF